MHFRDSLERESWDWWNCSLDNLLVQPSAQSDVRAKCTNSGGTPTVSVKEVVRQYYFFGDKCCDLSELPCSRKEATNRPTAVVFFLAR